MISLGKVVITNFPENFLAYENGPDDPHSSKYSENYKGRKPYVGNNAAGWGRMDESCS